ncbi:hypothetical protein IV203_014525 [Nitzschia inconspicua]|uniref:Uncharacterized protein n=1 Tax=Nitzschia inconspicua TaxID=303405 RepID=A0A9K3L9I9_9STRA|nr:hypothetical protein IV203_014525 [Nitzschia inconspicua]
MAAITFVSDDRMEKGEATVAPVHETHFRVVDDLAAEGMVVGGPNGREVGPRTPKWEKVPYPRWTARNFAKARGERVKGAMLYRGKIGGKTGGG